jgi:uncharacterized protein YabE (DUF348 family)/3D (Asp-Asp-Asp) domain-containing protein
MRHSRRRGYEGGNEKVGFIPVKETHDPRPTGKLFAARWKHEHLRLILLCAILSFALTILFLLLLHGVSAAKSVTVVDDGKSVVIHSHKGDVQSLLREQNISVRPYDRVSVPLTAKVEDGDRIVIDRAVPVTMQADGKTEVRFTTEDTVGDALQALGVKLSGEDRVTPSPDTPVSSGMAIRVIRVKREIVETQHPLTFAVAWKKDANLPQGQQKVVQTGKEGVLVKRWERVYEDGRLVDERILDKIVARPAVQKVVAVGAKKKPEVAALSYDSGAAAKTIQLDGRTILVKRVLRNVTLTAYSAGPASTGKSRDDPGYGVTATGTRVQEGRTIAVDPRVIPLGWWVYIEGIGFRRAEDTGGAIKGNKIDVYYDSENYVNRFGTKRGYTVYVIGPVKPSAD